MGTVLAVLIGLGLAAACGFRVFVPLLIVSIAARSGHLGLAQGMAWLGSTEAVVALSTATVIEIVAYKVPWLDHVLDVIASPAAVIAGALVAASQIGTISPSGSGGELLMWSSGLIAGGVAGGAVAGITQTASVTTRALSTTMTAGIANPFINMIQSVLSVIVSVLAIVAPLLVVVVLILIALVLVRVRKRRGGRRTSSGGIAPGAV